MAHNLEARLNSYWPIALTVFRVVIGLLFLCQGLTKVFGWPDAAHKAAVDAQAAAQASLASVTAEKAAYDQAHPAAPATAGK